MQYLLLQSAFYLLWGCSFASFLSSPPCSVMGAGANTSKLVKPEFSVQFLCPLPILVAWQLSTMEVFIMLLTASQPQAGTGELKAKYKPVLGVHHPQQVSVHPRQWWSDARGSGQLHGVTASVATVEVWLLSKTKQNRVFLYGDNPSCITEVILEGITYLWVCCVTSDWLHARPSLPCSSCNS